MKTVLFAAAAAVVCASPARAIDAQVKENFRASAVKACLDQPPPAGISKEVMVRFCTCYAEYVAGIVTDEEIAVAEASRMLPPSVMAKAQEAAKVCLPKARGQ